MPHVELSLLPSRAPQSGRPNGTGTGTDSLDRWAEAVRVASEPCMVIDVKGRIVACSVACCELLCLGDPAEVEQSYLLDGVLRLLDFTAARGELVEAEMDKIPPLLALSSGRLARGLMRVGRAGDSAVDATVDAVATPLTDGGEKVGSLTFFAPI